MIYENHTIFSLITLLNQLEITYTVWTKKIYATLFFNKIYLPFLEDSIENKVYNRFDLFAHTLADFVIHKNPPK